MRSESRTKGSGASALGKKKFESEVDAPVPSTATGPEKSLAGKRSHGQCKGTSRQSKPRPQQPKAGTINHFPLVGVGASAGGLEAFTELLKHLPLDSGMGFVLVQHLDPQHESALTGLLQRATSMPVREVKNNLRVEANHVYVIPPNTNLGIAQGVLKLQPRPKSRGAHHSIDAFLESLAQDQRERAIGVILSGTATDGTLGLEAIKAEGGITFAQDDSAKYDSMPRSAIAAGCVDFVLKPEKIAQELARIAKHPYVQSVLPPHSEIERGGDQGESPEAPLASGGRGSPRTGAKQARAEAKAGGEQQESVEQHGFKKILLLLRNHCGVDFSLYRSATIQRRITRRMVLSKHDRVEGYAQFLRGNTKELDALYSDCLISVTSFFRNPEAFELVQRKVFPKLFQQRERSDEPIRVWVLGCSTGQEAYSMAMAFQESQDKFSRARRLQVFATDLNDALLDKARHGLYTKNLAQDISPERLRRFFVEEAGGYRVIKSLREMVVFARQNLISDPPFSRMDLISCRNLLIYLEPSLQKKALPMFHYALKPEGFLFLGASESITGFSELFEPIHKRHKIYSRKAAITPSFHLVGKNEFGQVRHVIPFGAAGSGGLRPLASPPGQPEGLRGELNAQHEADRLMVNQFAPPGVLINSKLQILQFRGPTSAWLKPPIGKASFDVLKMAREGLMLPLRASVNKAKKENKTVRREKVRVQQNGQALTVNIEVIPLQNLSERCFLILFEEVKESGFQVDSDAEVEQVKGVSSSREQRGMRPKDHTPTQSRRNAELERELADTRDYLQSIHEQHEASNEELQASNEEVQSANEELQSINEELETAKEELESSNEELTTLNEEMGTRNTELGQLNSDLLNLQTSTTLGILLLGRDLTIRRFSVRAEKQFNLMAADVGRPIGSIRHNFDLTNLEEFLDEVIVSVREREREVQDKEGRWYSLRARPYFTVDNKADGAVVVVVDITDLKQTELEIKSARNYAEAVIRTARDPLVVLLADLRVNTANEAFYKKFKTTPDQTEGRLIYELGNRQWDIPKLRTLLEDILPRNSFFNDFEVTHEFPEIGARKILLNARRLDPGAGTPALILLAMEDVTEWERAETALASLAAIVNSSEDAIIGKDLNGVITSWNKGAERLFGYTEQEAIGQSVAMLIPPDRQQEESDILEKLRGGQSVKQLETVRVRKDGSLLEISLVVSPIRDASGQVIGASKIARDITERKQAEAALRQAQAKLADRAGQLEQVVAERTVDLTTTNQQLETFVYSIAHDLRAPLRSMQGFSELLVEEAGAVLSEKARNFANHINHAAQFMDALLVDLLAFSRISQQRLELTSVNLETLVASVLFRLQTDIQEKNARVESTGPWPVVLAHEPTLAQVLVNLIDNALKFAASGTLPIVCVRAEERRASCEESRGKGENGNWVRVWVEDNGIGIAPDHQEQIFRLFTRLNGEKYLGTGIGLAIVQKGVERMGGRVGVESSPGQGSRFWLELKKAHP